MKKIICLLMLFAVVLAFSSCAKDEGKPEQAENSSTSTTLPTGRIYYDKYANEFESLEEMPYYDKDGNKYYLADQIEQIFVDEKGGRLDGGHCFVDTHGVFVYDYEDEITLTDSLSAKDKNGRIYYPASTVRWTNDKVMINAFGMGQEVVPD